MVIDIDQKLLIIMVQQTEGRSIMEQYRCRKMVETCGFNGSLLFRINPTDLIKLPGMVYKGPLNSLDVRVPGCL